MFLCSYVQLTPSPWPEDDEVERGDSVEGEPKQLRVRSNLKLFSPFSLLLIFPRKFNFCCHSMTRERVFLC